MSDADVELDRSVRRVVYERTMRSGMPPPIAAVADDLERPGDEIAASFQRLADAHMLVLQPLTGEILMAPPYSAVPTAFVVEANGTRSYGNCMWDGLGILAALAADGEVKTSCADCGTAAVVSVADGEVRGEGIVHFALPVREWWNDVVFT